MRKEQKKFAKKKIAVLIVILALMFFLFKVGQSLASTDSFIITNAAISSKSDTVEVKDFKYEDYSLKSNIIFHNVGDSVVFKINIKNNKKNNYTIVSVSDDNENEYISYEYENYEGVEFNSNDEISIYITEKYNKEVDISNREQTFSTNIYITLVDENGEETEEVIPINKPSSPKTGDYLSMYVTMATLSFMVLIILLKKKNSNNNGKHIKMFSLIIIGTLIIPTVSKAVAIEKLCITLENVVSLKDKLIFSYKINDEVNEKILSYNEIVDGVEAPDKAGYKFLGWQKENGEFIDISAPITEDTSVEAKYEIIEYDISYDLDGGNVNPTNPLKYTVEDEITLNNPTKDGVKFSGWTGSNGTTPQKTVKISKGSTGNKNYTANWRGPETFEIRFDSNGGSDIDSKYITEGNALGTLQIPEKENYKFRGWYTDNTYTTKVNKNTIPTESTTYYAKWVDRMETVFSVENSVTLNGKDEAIADGEVPDEYLGSDGKFIDSHIALFNNTNYDKDFEIGFTIVSYDPNDQDYNEKMQYSFVNTKDEDGTTSVRPGVVFRISDRDTNQLELAAGTTKSYKKLFSLDYSETHTVKIYRISDRIYYSIDGAAKKDLGIDYSTFAGRFGTTTTFGASVEGNGTVFRHLRATLSDMYIKLEVDDYQED